MAVVNVNEDNFSEEVLNSKQPVLVDFWAAWCGPCKMLAPVVDEIADENDSIKVCKVNVDDNQKLAIEYNVMSIPTLILFKDGSEEKRLVGLVSKGELQEWI